MKLNISDLSFRYLNRINDQDYNQIREFIRHESIHKNFLAWDGSPSVYNCVCVTVLFLIEDTTLEISPSI